MSTISRSLLIVGDSITLGATEVVGTEVLTHASQSFVQILRQNLPSLRIDLDAAVRRTTTEAAGVLPALLQKFRPDRVLLMLGGNDVDLNWRRYIVSTGTKIVHNVEVAKFEENLRRLVAEARESGVMPILSDLPSLDLAGRTLWLSTKAGVDVAAIVRTVNANGETEVRERLLAYNDAVNRVASDLQVTVVRWAAQIPSLPHEQRFGPDSLHPGDRVHPIIAQTVTDTLRRLDVGPSVSVPA